MKIPLSSTTSSTHATQESKKKIKSNRYQSKTSQGGATIFNIKDAYYASFFVPEFRSVPFMYDIKLSLV